MKNAFFCAGSAIAIPRNFLLSVLLLTVLLAFSYTAPLAQSKQEQAATLRLTLEEAVEIASENNFSNQIAARETEISKYGFRKTHSLFLPQISIEETAISTDNPLNVFGTLLRQEQVAVANFDPAFLNDPGSTQNFTTSINVRQPVFNPDGLLSRGVMKDRFRASREMENRTRHLVSFQVGQQYYELLLANRRIGIVNTALQASRANRKQAQDLFDQGLISKADLLASDVRLKQLESKRSEAVNDRAISENRLGYLLGLDGKQVILPVDSLVLREVKVPEVNYELINRTRSDMKALEYSIDASRKSYNANRVKFVPSINLFGTYEWNDEIFLGTGAGNYLIGATLKWDIFAGFKNLGALRQSRAELKKAELVFRDRAIQNRIEIEKNLRSLEDAGRQVKLARAAVEQAKESYRIRFNRYRQGMERVTDILSSEATLAESKLQEASAIYRYNVMALRLELMLEKDIIDETNEYKANHSDDD